MSIKRVGLYGRVAQDSGESRVLERQMEFLRRWAAEKGYTVAGETAAVRSGFQVERPGLAEATRAVREKKMDAVVVKDLSRLMRDYIAGMSFINFLQAEGVEPVSICDGQCIDTIQAISTCFKV